MLYDPGQAVVFLRRSFLDLKKTLNSKPPQYSKAYFEERKKWIQSVLNPKQLSCDCDFKEFSLGNTEEEIQYREWCLRNRLFLNPLNDLETHSIAANDVLTMPSMNADIGDGPYYHAYYNQLKQEFVSSRLLYFEGIHSKKPHFSDRNVLLYNLNSIPKCNSDSRL